MWSLKPARWLVARYSLPCCPSAATAMWKPLPSQRQEDFIGAIANAFAYLGGVPACGLIDNLKSGVKRANRYEPAFTELLEQLSLHYGCTFIPRV
ncbi:MAG: hypothetical protein H6566_23585 [Lewinellaceae bacterium]|nr:hypothetical protein [Lewinellaceae bacterium]